MVLAAVAFGLLCRIAQYAANTSIWHDEALVALTVFHRDFAGLLGPLEGNEAAPPGFLVAEKLVVSWLGRSEYALRLLPLLAGLAGMICFAGLARRVCGVGEAALWAVVLMAASAKLIVQSNEVKHFTLDLLWAVWLGWLAIQIGYLRRPSGTLLAWGALGAVGLWFSFASLFVFAGTSLALAPRAMRAWRRSPLAGYLLANLAVLASLYVLLGPIRAQITGTLVSFWATSFPDTGSLPALLYWLGRSHLGLFNYFWQPLGAPLLALAILGGIRCWGTDRRFALALLVMPLLMALAASLLHRWPFGGNQHMVFAASAVLLLVAEGAAECRRRLARWRGWAGWMFLALLLLPGVADASYRIVSPRHRHEVRPVVEFVYRHLERGDRFAVFDPVTVEFYAGRDFLNPPGELSRTARVWFIASRAPKEGFLPQAQDMLDRLRTRRPQLRAVEENGAAAYLFGPERPPGDARGTP